MPLLDKAVLQQQAGVVTKEVTPTSADQPRWANAMASIRNGYGKGSKTQRELAGFCIFANRKSSEGTVLLRDPRGSSAPSGSQRRISRAGHPKGLVTETSSCSSSFVTLALTNRIAVCVYIYTHTYTYIHIYIHIQSTPCMQYWTMLLLMAI